MSLDRCGKGFWRKVWYTWPSDREAVRFDQVGMTGPNQVRTVPAQEWSGNDVAAVVGAWRNWTLGVEDLPLLLRSVEDTPQNRSQAR